MTANIRTLRNGKQVVTSNWTYQKAQQLLNSVINNYKSKNIQFEAIQCYGLGLFFVVDDQWDCFYDAVRASYQLKLLQRLIQTLKPNRINIYDIRYDDECQEINYFKKKYPHITFQDSHDFERDPNKKYLLYLPCCPLSYIQLPKKRNMSVVDVSFQQVLEENSIKFSRI